MQTMTVGANITAFGEIKISRYGVQMAHPEYHITGTKTFESGLLPIYPTVKGLHQNKLRQLVRLAINAVHQTPLTCLSDDDFDSVGVTVQGDLLSALMAIHLPDPQADIFSQTALLTGLKRAYPSCLPKTYHRRAYRSSACIFLPQTKPTHPQSPFV